MFLTVWIASFVAATAEFNLTILHTNDVHARIEEADIYGGPCTAELSVSGDCYGGASRVRTKVLEKRKQYPNSTLVLDAGDQFQGTVWYYVYGGNVTSEFMNLIGYDAMAIGNHEFDGGVKGLAPFAHSIKFPMLATNVDLSNTPELADVVKNSTVINVNGHEIGIVGYITTATAYISSPETVIIADELVPVQAEIDKLVKEGVKIIVALGHSGYYRDLELAKRLKDVDIVVGGHTNTFLYTGDDPSSEKAEGKYPTVVDNMHEVGRKVLVVQDYAFGKYLGELHVTFDDQGEVTAWSGNPILLDKSVEKDKEIEVLVQKYKPGIENMKMTVIGEAYVDLLSDRIRCRTTECNLGNLITDAVVHANVRTSDPNSWSDVGIAIVNAGSFRSSIPKGNITIETVIFVQPFRNTIYVIEIRGQTLLDMLEFAASKWSEVPSSVFGGFLQVSGLQITYDTSRPAGQRVVEVLAVCTKCRVPALEPLQPEKTYKVLTSSYLIKGGEGYSMLPDAILSKEITDTLDTDILLKYIKARTPIVTGLENRIRHLKDISPKLCGGADQALLSSATKFIVPLMYVWFKHIL
ncbi:hypothetical protein BsWGS_12317 [Bradybaena similaris]